MGHSNVLFFKAKKRKIKASTQKKGKKSRKDCTLPLAGKTNTNVEKNIPKPSPESINDADNTPESIRDANNTPKLVPDPENAPKVSPEQVEDDVSTPNSLPK